MPIHVDIRINDKLINTIHIGRIEGDMQEDSINTYIAVEGDEPLRINDWQERGYQFQHRYGDGAEVCVAKALNAMGYHALGFRTNTTVEKKPKKWDGNGRNYTKSSDFSEGFDEGFAKGFRIGQLTPEGKLGKKVT